MNTFDNPGCYHSALSYCSKITGIPIEKEIVLNSLDDVKRRGRLIYPSSKIKVELDGKQFIYPKVITKKGGIRVYSTGEVEYPIDTVFDKVIITIPRNIEEFGLPIIPEGKYKDSLGGGWYSIVKKFRINDQYFAMMECTCS